MNTTKTILTSLVASIIVVAIGFLVVHPTNTTLVNNSAPLVKGTSPEISSPYFIVNGVTEWYGSENMAPATTTLCALISPNATSTLQYTSFQITTGTSTAATIDIGTSTTPYATTTNLVAATSIASGAQGLAFWMPTQGTSQNSIMSPNTYVVVKTAGAGLAGYTYGGKCQAEFTQF